VQPRSKRQRTCTGGTVPGAPHRFSDAGDITGGTVPWAPHRFSDAGGISGYCVYVAFNRLAFNDVSQLLATDAHEPLTSRIPDLNSSDPRACDDYWSEVTAIVRATIFRGARPQPNSFNSSVSDTVPVIDINSPAAHFLNDCLGAFPPFAFKALSVMPIHVASSQGTLPLEEYRRLRLCRATGDLPRLAAIPAGLSCEIDATQAAPIPDHVPNGQFRGNISAVIWNSQALFCHKDDKHEAKANYVHKLAAQYDIILLSEVHGLHGGPELWRPPCGFEAYWSLGSEAGSAGGQHPDQKDSTE